MAIASVAALVAVGLVVANDGGDGDGARESGSRYVGYLERTGGEKSEEEREREAEEHGVEGVVGGAESESAEIMASITSVANARLAPYGSVAAGQLSSSLGSFRGLASNGSICLLYTSDAADE